MTSKPHIILIHGAYHDGSCYDRVTPLLHASGYESTAVDLPSAGTEPPATTLEPDIECVRSAIQPLLDAGRDIVVVMHSYGGIVGTTSLSGMSKKHRSEQHLEGGVTHLVYLASRMPYLGQSTKSMGGGRGGSVGSSAHRLDGEKMYHMDPVNRFYHDIPKDEAEEYAKRLKWHSMASLSAPATSMAWTEVESTYLVCHEDRTIEVEQQWESIDQAKGMGAKVNVVECNSGHSPFLSQPGLVSRVIRRAAGENIDVGQ